MKRYPDPTKLALADLREEVDRLRTFLTELCQALSDVVEKTEHEFGINITRGKIYGGEEDDPNG